MHNPAYPLPPVAIEMAVIPAVMPLPAYAPPAYVDTGSFMAMPVGDAPPSYRDAIRTSDVATLPPMNRTAHAVSFYVRNKGSINGAAFGGIVGTCFSVIAGGSIGFGIGGVGIGFVGIPVTAGVVAPALAVACAILYRNSND